MLPFCFAFFEPKDLKSFLYSPGSTQRHYLISCYEQAFDMKNHLLNCRDKTTKTTYNKIGTLICSIKFLFRLIFSLLYLGWCKGVFLVVYQKFHLFILEGGGLLIILIDFVIFLLPFGDVARMSMSTIAFLAQLDPGILCL